MQTITQNLGEKRNIKNNIWSQLENIILKGLFAGSANMVGALNGSQSPLVCEWVNEA